MTALTAALLASLLQIAWVNLRSALRRGALQADGALASGLRSEAGRLGAAIRRQTDP